MRSVCAEASTQFAPEAIGSGSVEIERFATDLPLRPEERAARHGDAFLVTLPASATRAHGPRGDDSDPPETLDGKLMWSGHRVWPVRRRGFALSLHVTIGRTANNDVHVADASVSGVHAYIRAERGAFAIEDAGSGGATYVGDAPVPPRGEGAPVPLVSGRTVRLGEVTLLFLGAVQFWRLVQVVSASARRRA